jgi:DNA-binding NarL/FixJ family response regulator
MLIGRTKLMLEDGYSIEQIAEKLKLQPSTVRAYQQLIEQAKKNKA